jgi:ribosomal-protein-serine acetyltransferase
MLEQLSNKTIILQRYSMDDADDLLSAIRQSYDEISPWMSWLTTSYDLKAAQEFINIQINNWDEDLEYTFSIRNHQGDFLGTIGIHLYDRLNDVASIGYWMNTQYCCKGYCAQAVKLLLDNTLNQLNLIRVEIIVATQNTASQRVAKKSGAKFEAVLKNRIRLHGKAIDANMNAIYSKS